MWISTDGRTWRAIAPERIELGDASKTQSMSDTAVWMSDLVTLPSGRLVAVGALNFEPGGAPAVWLSDDAGESWRRTPGPVTTESESAGMESVTLTAAGKIVAVGGRDPSDLSRSPMAWTSTDGSVWASVELPGLDRVSAPAQPPSGQQPLPRAAWVSSVAANGDVVVAVGGDSDNRPLLLSSRDLLTWQLVEPRPALRGSLSAVVATGAGFLAVGASEAGDGLAYEVDASGSSVRDASGGGSFAGPGSQALWGAAVARDDSWIVVGEDDGRAAVWTRGGGQWVKAAGDEALWPRGSIGTVSVSPYGLVALGHPAGKNADSEQILWLGTPP